MGDEESLSLMNRLEGLAVKSGDVPSCSITLVGGGGSKSNSEEGSKGGRGSTNAVDNDDEIETSLFSYRTHRARERRRSTKIESKFQNKMIQSGNESMYQAQKKAD
jgi:hypothetical protein